MPIYEYICTACQDRFELIQSFSDQPLTKCEKCGGNLQKLMSECAVHFKGSGWYVTDYGKSGSSRRPSKSSTSEQKSETSAPKTDSASTPSTPSTEKK